MLSENKICNNCKHKDICKYSGEAFETKGTVDEIKDNINQGVFEIKFRCKKYEDNKQYRRGDK